MNAASNPGPPALTPCPGCNVMSTEDHQRFCSRRAAPATPPVATSARPKPRRKGGPRKKVAPWTPLPPPPEDTAWMVTRDVELRTISPNRLGNEHWKSRHHRRAKEHRAIRSAFADVALPSLERGVIVTLTRTAMKLVDTDRLSGSLYAVRDAVADALGTDDSARAPIEWRYQQHREVVREPVRHQARSARPADPAKGLSARPARASRDAWRYRMRLRVTIESTVEPAGGGVGAACDPGNDEAPGPVRASGAACHLSPVGRAGCLLGAAIPWSPASGDSDLAHVFRRGSLPTPSR